MAEWRLLRALLRGVGGWWLLATGLLALTWLAGIALLALSGWFITATALAGAGLLLGLDIFLPSTGIRAAAVLRTLSRYGERVLGHEAVLRLLARLRRDSFAALAAMPLAQQRGWRSGDLQARLGGDIDTLDAVPLRLFGPLFAALLAVAGALAVAWWLGPPAAAGLVLLNAVLATAAAALAAWRGEVRGRGLVAARARQRVAVLDHVGGLAELSGYRRLDRSRETLRQLEGACRDGLQRQRLVAVFGEQAVQLMVGLSVLTMILVGLHGYRDGLVSAPVAVLLALMVFGLNEVLGSLPGAFWRLGESLEAARRLAELGDGVPASRQPAPAAAAAVPPGPASHAPDGAGGAGTAPRLHTRNLVCGHRPGQGVAVPDLELRPGLPLVVVGASGIGKSSLLATLAGELSPLAGALWLDGADPGGWDAQHRYQLIGYLPQQLRFIDAGVAENLRLADPCADAARLGAALRFAGLGGLARPGPRGLDFRIGEDGQRLSGGQLRRLGLAWLWLRQPGLAVLDEPLRGLDRETEARVLLQLAPWLQARTSVIASHAPQRLPDHWPRLHLGAQPGPAGD